MFFLTSLNYIFDRGQRVQCDTKSFYFMQELYIFCFSQESFFLDLDFWMLWQGYLCQHHLVRKVHDSKAAHAAAWPTG